MVFPPFESVFFLDNGIRYELGIQPKMWFHGKTEKKQKKTSVNQNDVSKR